LTGVRPGQCSYDWDLRNPHIYDLFPKSADLNDHISPFRTADAFVGGNYDVVYRAELKQGGTVAVKLLFGNCQMEGRALKLALRVAWQWSGVKHRNILPFMGIAEFPKIAVAQHGVQSLSLVSPYMESGNIMDYLAGDPEADRIRLLLHVIQGLDHLHRHDPPIIHGGLRGNNVLIDLRDGAPRALITDFGQERAKQIYGDEYLQDTAHVPRLGHPRWIAFERVAPWRYGFETVVQSDTVASDVFELLRTFLEACLFTRLLSFLICTRCLTSVGALWTSPILLREKRYICVQIRGRVDEPKSTSGTVPWT